MYALTTHSRAPLTTDWLLVAACTAAGLVVVPRWGAVGVAIVAALLLGGWAAAVDIRDGRLPNALVAASALPTTAVVIHGLTAGAGTDAVLAVVVGAALMAVPLFAVHVVAPAAMGFGDVKLAAALGALIGLVDMRGALLALCFASAGTAVVGLATRRPTMPLGPGLVVGTAAAFVVAGLGGTTLPWR